MPSSAEIAPVEFLLEEVGGIFLVKAQPVSNELLRLDKSVFKIEDIAGF